MLRGTRERLHHVPEPAHRANADAGRFQLDAQPRDIDFDRVAFDFVTPGIETFLEPGAGHKLQVGAGYGAGDERAAQSIGLAEPERAHGAVFLRDRWRIGERLTTTAGARYTYLGFLPDHYAEPFVRAGRLRAVAPELLQYRCRFWCIRRRAPAPLRIAQAFQDCLLQAHR